MEIVRSRASRVSSLPVFVALGELHQAVIGWLFLADTNWCQRAVLPLLLRRQALLSQGLKS